MSKFVKADSDSTSMDDIKELIAMLTKGPLDRWRAVQLGLKVITSLVDLFGGAGGTFQTASIKAGRVSNKQVAAALQSLVDGGKSVNQVQAKALPIWLLPVLMKLVLKWLENRKKD